jgi:hypothetical protein
MLPFRQTNPGKCAARHRWPLAIIAALCILANAQHARAAGSAERPLAGSSVDALALVVAAWISHETGLPMPAAMPRIIKLDRADLSMRFRGETAGRTTDGVSEVVALYDQARRTILLPEGWTGATPAETSILVHEMVHHMQTAAGLRYSCPGEREALAFRAQANWLARFGESLERSFGINDMFLKLATICGF